MSQRRVQNMGRKHALDCSDEVNQDGVDNLASEAWWNVAFFEAEDEGLDSDFNGRSAEDIFCESFSEAYAIRKGWKPAKPSTATKTKAAVKPKAPAPKRGGSRK